MKAIWDEALSAIRARVTGENFATYFAPLRFVGTTGDEVQLEVADPFFRDWVKLHYQDLLNEAVSQASGQPMRVVLAIREATVEPRALPAPAEESPEDSMESMPRVITASEGPRASEAHAFFPLNPHYTFDSYVVGPNNEMACAACSSVARQPGRAFNPLFIYGGTGLGKTHLLQAVAHRILAADPHARVVYVSAEEFTNQVIKSISRQRMDAFRERFRGNCDVLLVDDVHVLSGKERTQEEFFYTFNALHAAQKQIILTSDKTPQEIQHLEERLRSRFQWGLITDVKAPQFETRVAILQRKAERDGIHLPDEVAFYLARLVHANVRELEGALTRLAAYASFHHRALTVAYAKEALKDVLDGRARTLTIDTILKMVAEHYDLKVADLRGSRRQRSVAHPRSVAMYLCRKHTQSSYPQIGRGFGGKDHSTVLAACRKIDLAMGDDAALRGDIESIERKFPL
ncbi:MAG: chromosomal replication initiator protein DnaA [bacterium]